MANVFSIAGYNNKKNKQVRTASEIAAFLAMKKGQKTLIIDLFNPDLDTPERMLTGAGEGVGLTSDNDFNVSDEGIDSALRLAEAQMLVKDDFDKYIRPVLKAENRLDILTCTRNTSFTSLLKSEARFDALKRIIVSATNIYENVILVLETTDKELQEQLIKVKLDSGKPLIDANIYCLKQGFRKKYDVAGRKVLFIVTDYDRESKFNIDNMRREYCPGLNSDKKMYKISRNVEEWDAAFDGKLVNFVFKNRNLNIEDVNYEWTKEQITIVNALLGERDTETNTTWEHLERINMYAKKKVLEDIDDMHKIKYASDEEYEERMTTDNAFSDDDIYAEESEIIEDLAEDVNDIIIEDKKAKKEKKGFSFFGKKKDKKDKRSEVVVEEEFTDEEIEDFGFAEEIVDIPEEKEEVNPANDIALLQELLKDPANKDKSLAQLMDELNNPKHEETTEEYIARLEAENKKLKADQAKKKRGPKPAAAKKQTVTKAKHATPITVAGKKYQSVADAAAAYNLQADTVRKRLKAGWTINKTFGIE